MSRRFPTGIGFDEAAAIVDAVARANRLPSEPVSLSRAHGRTLAADVLALMDLSRERVQNHFGVTLEPEIRILGEG